MEPSETQVQQSGSSTGGAQGKPQLHAVPPPAPPRIPRWIARWMTPFGRRATKWVMGKLGMAMLLALGALLLWGIAPEQLGGKKEFWYLPVVLGALPLGLTLASFVSATARINSLRFELHQPPGDFGPAELRILDSVQESWGYERQRFRAAVSKTGTHAVVFGVASTLVLAVPYALYWKAQELAASVATLLWGSGHAQTIARLLVIVAVACASAGAVCFVLQFARILLRLSSQDFNARMYSWSTRALLLVVTATLVGGTFLARGDKPLVTNLHEAVLLGATIAALGGNVLELLANKAATLFGIGTGGASRTSDLVHVEGLTKEDIERLAEEGVESVHALAFVPTGRLFFGTNHSLQRIVDWQDQALLYVYLGEARARAVKERMALRGAIDLWGIAVAAAKDPKAPERAALAQATGFDEGQLVSLLKSLEGDQVIRRIHAHWRATVRVRSTVGKAAKAGGDDGKAAG